jgi:hypothetical protein
LCSFGQDPPRRYESFVHHAGHHKQLAFHHASYPAFATSCGAETLAF